MAWIR